MRSKSIFLAVLLAVILTISISAEITGGGENLLLNSRHFWSQMDHSDKILYVQGVLSGLYATYEEMEGSGRSDIARRIEKVIPWDLKVDEIISVIDHAYRFDRFEKVPIWYMIVSIDEVLRDLEEKGDL